MKVLTTTLGIIAVIVVWWVIATDPWVSEHFVRISLILMMVGFAFVLGLAIGVAKGERTGRAEGYEIGMRERKRR